MLYALSFATEFFWGTVPIEKMKPSPRPTGVYQALLSLPYDQWAELARDVFNCHPDNLDVETILDKVLETDTCENLDPPVRVHIDPEGWYSILVYEEKP
ncbi:MAG: hypothetical protein HY289_01120 [Planctomycetes bacterium]|nr:hypothetical protein [Planctomycetota bacterium]